MFFNAEFSDPWGFASPASQTLACTLAPGAPHVVIYHLLTEGCAIAQTQSMSGQIDPANGLRALFCIWLRKRRLAESAAMRCWRSFPRLFSSTPCADT